MSLFCVWLGLIITLAADKMPGTWFGLTVTGLGILMM